MAVKRRKQRKMCLQETPRPHKGNGSTGGMESGITMKMVKLLTADSCVCGARRRRSGALPRASMCMCARHTGLSPRFAVSSLQSVDG